MSEGYEDGEEGAEVAEGAGDFGEGGGEEGVEVVVLDLNEVAFGSVNVGSKGCNVSRMPRGRIEVKVCHGATRGGCI